MLFPLRQVLPGEIGQLALKAFQAIHERCGLGRPGRTSSRFIHLIADVKLPDFRRDALEMLAFVDVDAPLPVILGRRVVGITFFDPVAISIGNAVIAATATEMSMKLVTRFYLYLSYFA